MRKYALPKVAYIVLILMIACLSIGYTYAYFSAIATAKGSLKMGTIDVVWLDNIKGGTIQTLFDDKQTNANEAMSIAITGKLKRGGYTQILTKDGSGNDVPIRLEISNKDGTVGAYCRMKITATYKHENGVETNCDDGWIQLALADYDDDTQKTLITDLDNGWVFNDYDDYYYYGITSNDKYVLRELEATYGQVVADYIYLSKDAPSEILGSSVKIVLTLESVQTTNDAYKTIWGLS